jgi:hypothetical protein
MSGVDCGREQDVLDAIAANRWPDRCERELQDHVVRCVVCGDLVEVVSALAHDREELWPDVHVPSAGTVFWRAQLRAREEAARQASRPIAAVQIVAAVALLVVLSAVGYLAAPAMASFTSLLAELKRPELATLPMPAIPPLGIWRTVAIAAAITWLLAAPLAFYLAGSED